MRTIGVCLKLDLNRIVKEVSLSAFSYRIRPFLPIALLVLCSLATLAVYLQALHYPFISDDEYYITNNSKLAALPLNELWRLFIEPYNPLEFLPLRDLSYWLDIKLFGLNPPAFRIHNIILYLLCLPLIYVNTSGLWRYFRPAEAASTSWVAATVTALFVLHPVHVEAVVWISGRKDLLAALFSLLSLWYAINAKREQGFSMAFAIAALVSLLAAMLSKATAVAMAPVIALLWMIFWRDISSFNKRNYLLIYPLASMLMGLVVTLFFMSKSTISEPAYYDIESFYRALAILGWLARLSVSPENHYFFYPVFEDSKPSVMIILGALILVSVVAGAVINFRKRTLAGFALVVFLLLCMPYMQLLPFKTTSLVADRFLFLAAWPALLLIVLFAWRLKLLPRIILLLAIALVWSYQSYKLPDDWRNEEVNTEKLLAAYPGHYLPAFQKIWGELREARYSVATETANKIIVPEYRNMMIGMIQMTYVLRFKTSSSGKPDEVFALMQNFESALNHLPAQSKWNPPMRYVRDRGKYVLALKGTHLAEQFPDDALIRYKVGLWKLDVSNYQEAVENLRAAIGLQRFPEQLLGHAYKSIGLALLRSKYVAEAETPLLASLEQSPPDLQSYCHLVEVYRQTGRLDKAAHADGECRNLAPMESIAQ